MSLVCATTVSAGLDPNTFILGTRPEATALRYAVERALEEGRSPVCVDFKGVLVSQSFMDEFLGVLIARNGIDILHRILLKNCHPDVQAAAQFVARIRASEAPAAH